MKRAESVRLAVSMSNVAAAICIDSIRDEHPGIVDEQLLLRARRRMKRGRRFRGV